MISSKVDQHYLKKDLITCASTPDAPSLSHCKTCISLDAQEVMKELRNIVLQALADFFTAMTAKKAHWYHKWFLF
jgi:hypothetical protein